MDPLANKLGRFKSTTKLYKSIQGTSLTDCGRELYAHMNKSPSPFCDDCIVPLTVHPIHLQCPTYEHQRRQMGNNLTMKNIFEKYCEFCGPLYRFVKFINILYDI